MNTTNDKTSRQVISTIIAAVIAIHLSIFALSYFLNPARILANKWPIYLNVFATLWGALLPLLIPVGVWVLFEFKAIPKPNKTLDNTKAFTLIELMIAVAIVGVLSAIALPAYQDYTIKAQVSEGLLLAEGLKVDAALYWAEKGTFVGWDPANTFAYSKLKGRYVSLGTTNYAGNIVIRYGYPSNEKIINHALSFMPDDTGNNLKWTCTAPGWEKKHAPKECVAN